jgi:RNA polymerase sigma factor (sigma-70 family)
VSEATQPVHIRAIHAAFRIESPRLIATLVRIVRDIGTAEDLAQEALVAALEEWPKSGVPDNPGAWLTQVAKNRALNAIKRQKMMERKHGEIGALETERENTTPDLDAALDDPVGDDMLRLIFTACHPVLTIDSRVALTLRLLGGLTTEEIARAFLVPEPTIQQRVVRAKRTIAEEHVPYEVPRGEELEERLAAVLGVIYLIFNEGYSATAGEDLVRPQLCEDALRLGRVLAQLVPDEPEVHGLVALMELNASRTPARTDERGEPVLLLEQKRERWDHMLIARGLAALERAGDGPYGIQASIAACHARDEHVMTRRAKTAGETDWARIASLYGELARLTPSPVIELNRAMAVAMSEGPAAGLAIIDELAREPQLREYPYLPSARADLLFKLGRLAEARTEFERAAALTKNARQRDQLLERAKSIKS